jgi:tripartite-type tricarboxylate transporter receptor subunit TctC
MTAAHRWLCVLAIGTMLVDVHAARAAYPDKPVRIVTGETGGASDFTSRLIALGATGALGQPIIVDNRGGAGGTVPGQIVSRAQPDGYTLLVYGGTIWLLPFMRDNVPWDAVKDFAPVTLAISSPAILVVHPSVPVSSVKDLIALARAKPGQLNYAAGAKGGPPHLSGELFKSMAGVDIVLIPYKGGGPSILGLVAGEVQMMFAVAGSVAPQVKAGKLKALAVTSAKPSALAPGLPTVAASGLPGFEATSTQGVFAPSKTSSVIVGRLNREIVRLLNQADMKEKLFNAGLETVASTPEQFAATIKSEMARLGKVIKIAGIHVD